MKKSRVIFVLVAVLMIACTLTACTARSAKFENVFSNGAYTDLSPAYSTLERINAENDTYYSSNNDFVLFKRNYEIDGIPYNAYEVYSLSQNEFITTITVEQTQSVDINSISINDGFAFVASVTYDANGNTASTLYDHFGEIVAVEYSDVDLSYNENTQLLSFGTRYFHVDQDGNVGSEVSQVELAGIPDFDTAAGDHYYQFEGTRAYIYNSQFDLIAEYKLPSYVQSVADYFHVLSNGNILAQYYIEEPEDSDDYNLFIDGHKATLVTEIYNVKTLSARKINLDYIIIQSVTRKDFEDSMPFLNEKIDNIAIGYEIQNMRIATDIKYISLSNNGVAKSVINETYMAQGMNMPELIADNRYIVSDNLGSTYILNQKGDVVGRINNATMFNEQNFVVNNKIYNFDCEMVYDAKSEGFTITKEYGKCYIMSRPEADGTFLYSNGRATLLISANDNKALNTSHSNFFYAYDENGYTFYNEEGRHFATLPGNYYTDLTVLRTTSDKSAVLISVYNTSTGGTEYYRIA